MNSLKLIMEKIKKNYIDIILMLLIPLISLRSFLFAPGYYSYSDQYWPLSNNLFFNGVSFNLLNYNFGLSRAILSWPYFLITLFTNNVILTERIFIYYTFLLYVFFAYIFASIITYKLLKANNEYIIKAVKFIIILFIYSNFTALNLNADGGTYSDGLILIFIAISTLSFLIFKNIKTSFYISATLLTISILLDPDYAPFFIISIIFVSLISGIMNRDFMKKLKYAFLSIIVAIIPLIFIMYGFFLTSDTVHGLNSTVSLRYYNFEEISWASGNINPFYSLILVGHRWSTIVFGPPSILFYGNKISFMNSSMYPAQILIPNGFITYLWFITVWLIPLLSIASIIFKNTRNITIPVFVLFIIFYIMSLVYYIKPLFYFEFYISHLPIIGSLIGETLALPGHAINVIAAMYYILFSITVVNIFNKNVRFYHIIKPQKNFIVILIGEGNFKNLPNKFIWKKNKFKIFMVIFILFIILFSGWQAFNGDFYPERAPAVPYGNHVTNMGSFTPVKINSSIINAYEFISSQSDNFNILWIGGPVFSNRVFEPPHPIANIPYLSYLVRNNLRAAFYDNLILSHVKYVIISNQDIQKNISGIYVLTFSNTGFKNFTNAENFLNSINGLTRIYSKNQVDIFEVNNFNSIYKSNLLLSYGGIDPNIAGIPYLFKTLGFNVSITNINGYGIPIEFNDYNKNENLSIYTPLNLTNFISNNNFKYFNLSSKGNFSGSGHNEAVNLRDNFTLALWSNSITNFSYNDGILNITNENSSLQTVSYNGSFVNVPGGFFNNNNYINLTISFFAKASRTGTGLIYFLYSLGNTNNIIFTKATYFNITKDYKMYVFSYLFSRYDKYADFRLQDMINGSFYLKNLSVRYEILPSISNDSSLPFGDYVTLNNTIIRGNYNISALIYMKNDTFKNYTWVKFNLEKGLKISNNSDIGALILIKNINILNNSNTYIDSIYPSWNAYTLIYKNKQYTPIPDIYGGSIFLLNENNVSLNSIKIIEKGRDIMLSIFIVIILYTSIFIIFITLEFLRAERDVF